MTDEKLEENGPGWMLQPHPMTNEDYGRLVREMYRLRDPLAPPQDEAAERPTEGDTVCIDRGNEPGEFRGVVEDVASTSHGGRMLVRCTESSCSKAHEEMVYSVGLSADWTVVDDD
ncbi:hypothetical protein DEQ92_20305 [Haloferax sp. Atlit-6N]|uniref:hypothetical protein n=1 Tax=Haloferax sp. Atlit-6N TaxID=2077205 RepID=UPI000E260C17|nr:hypothetical protein [Haloferax sp. Atlit-6N]REA00198.1 hypothetical protein DEQ92_20305 [Haloferax sp. Atlit-6N]